MSIIDAWIRMGAQMCAKCGKAMVPAAKGHGADEPGYCGFEPCSCGQGNETPRPRYVDNELLDACLAVLRDYDHKPHERPTEYFSREHFEKLRSAISKVRPTL